MQNREWRESEGAKREAAGSELQIRWEQSIAAHLHGPFCASWALPLCFWELWTPWCAPSAPWLSLRGYPKPWCPFWEVSPLLGLFCAMPRPQRCLWVPLVPDYACLGSPQPSRNLLECTEPLHGIFCVTEPRVCLWAPLHTPVCVSIVWGRFVHPQLSGCALGYPRAPTEPLATKDLRRGIRNTPMEG